MSDIATALKDAAQAEVRNASSIDIAARPWANASGPTDSYGSPSGRNVYDGVVGAESRQLRAVSGAALAAVSEAAEILSEGVRAERRQQQVHDQQRRRQYAIGEVAEQVPLQESR